MCVTYLAGHGRFASRHLAPNDICEFLALHGNVGPAYPWILLRVDAFCPGHFGAFGIGTRSYKGLGTCGGELRTVGKGFAEIEAREERVGT